MSEQKQKKGLIIYYSVTGNTEKIAFSFKKAMEKCGWGCDLLKINKQVDLDINNLPYRADDYDLICIGGPNYRSILPEKLISKRNGVLTPERLFRVNPGWGSVADDWQKKCVAFTTYGGGDRGVAHADSCLNMIEVLMENMKIKCIGKFAACGGMWVKPPVDAVAQAMYGGNEELASEAIGRYIDNSDSPEFAGISEGNRELFNKARESIKRGYMVNPGIGRWHWDRMHRPYERDSVRAEIFMLDILEDFFGDVEPPLKSRGVEAYGHCQYLSII